MHVVGSRRNNAVAPVAAQRRPLCLFQFCFCLHRKREHRERENRDRETRTQTDRERERRSERQTVGNMRKSLVGSPSQTTETDRHFTHSHTKKKALNHLTDFNAFLLLLACLWQERKRYKKESNE